ncbi:MAG: hypothetical protein OSB21_01335 [Myxococcota bacterium]|jgi:hypothetical protein|nr:hypothetical protein [Myxococcota bacterium]
MRLLTIPLLLATCLIADSALAEEQFKMSIRVIHATKSGQRLDPSLMDLKADLAQLAFTSFKLLDGHSKTVFDREVVALEFPGSRWLEVRTQGVAKDGGLKISLKVRDLKFKAKAKVGAGSTVLLGGPPHQGGSIILAVTATKL